MGGTLFVGENDDIQIKGATDGTLIGNTSDRLRVSAVPSSTATTIPGLVKLAYDDMNVANGGVARDTAISNTYVTIYNRTGAGHILGFTVTLEGNLTGADEYQIKFTVDSLVVAELSTIDLGTTALYNLIDDGDALLFGWQLVSNSIVFKTPGNAAIRYNSSVKVEIKKTSATTKRFRAGLIGLTKD